MKRILRRVGGVLGGLLMVWTVVGVAAPASAAVPYTVYIRQEVALTRSLGILGTAETRDPVNELLGSAKLWEMNHIQTYQGSWVVTFEYSNSNLCLDKSMDTTGNTNVYLYPCSGAQNQKWLLQKTGSISGANLHYIRTFYQGVGGGACLKTNTTGLSSVGACNADVDEYAIYAL
ncbi:hypothetical protein Acor_50110 [Acrocarpospora corrugata]|uniref:Uncharacterized protein n=1 Tax=Acrocarpospora corrugata TaxID=35763 RepID=A0A5M3W1P5_9ACTN|nr:RICIN domain-containing protein [Acrocarpospora corrugata]GES02945.1 hypothetical protein Acor_50110 [Acrocarpospora corrugata]